MSTAPQISAETVRSAAGVIVAFQVAAFTLRINREIDVGDERSPTWLPPADYINLASMTVTLVGFFIAPILGIYGDPTSFRALGLSLVFLACYPFALAGHYELFNRRERTFLFFPRQEKIAVAVTLLLVMAYITFSFVTLR